MSDKVVGLVFGKETSEGQEDSERSVNIRGFREMFNERVLAKVEE